MTPETYVDLDGGELVLVDLDAEERRLVALLRARASTHPDWTDFEGFCKREVAALYDARGMSRGESRNTAAYRIGQDLAHRLGIAGGFIEPDADSAQE